MSELRKQEMSLKNVINHEVAETRLRIQKSQSNLIHKCSEQMFTSIQQCQEQVNNFIFFMSGPVLLAVINAGDMCSEYWYMSRDLVKLVLH